jgi:hypothetical protein
MKDLYYIEFEEINKKLEKKQKDIILFEKDLIKLNVRDLGKISSFEIDEGEKYVYFNIFIGKIF